MFGLRFQNWQVANQIKRLVPDGALPADEGWSAFGFAQFVHRHLPGPLGHHRIGCGQIGPRQPQIQMRLPVRLGFGGEQRGRFHAVAGLQTFLFAGFIVMDVINAAIAAVETESLLHIIYEAA
jgi:hypothetical protein